MNWGWSLSLTSIVPLITQETGGNTDALQCMVDVICLHTHEQIAHTSRGDDHSCIQNHYSRSKDVFQLTPFNLSHGHHFTFQNTNIPACSSADTTLEDMHPCCEEGSSHQGSLELHPFQQPSSEEAGSKEKLEVEHMGFAAR